MPGIRFVTGPDIDEWAEICFVMFLLPQELQMASSFVPRMRISLDLPQSWHLNSKRGIHISLCLMKNFGK
jgi:hypothetical protein